MRALWAGVSGLKNHQTRMDVIGNNIANVNTVGFKSSRVTFQDMLSQTIQGAGAPSGTVGGTNPIQIGMGMAVASVDTMFTDGSAQSTGNQTDLALSGQGFFQLSNDNGASNKVYTRDGAFNFDENGDYVVPSTGYKVMGYQVNAAGSPTGTPVPIHISKTDLMPGNASTTLTFSNNLLASALATTPANAILLNSVKEANAAAAGAAAAPGATAVTVNTAVAASNASAADKAAVAVQAGLPGATAASVAAFCATNLATTTTAVNPTSDIPTSINVYASSGTAYKLNGTFEKTTANTWTFTPIGTITDPTTGATIGNVSTTPGPLTATTLTFSASGAFVSSTVPYTLTVTPVIPPAPAAGPAPFTITPDFSTMTQYDSKSTAMATKTDGYAAGSLDKLTISASGMFVATYTNGITKNVAQVALFSFNNPGGLEKSGDNLYMESNNSGVATKDQTTTVSSGNLEMSNVDLAQQFSDMIVTQRGFQANSKIITTTDSMLEELVNLKR